MELYGNGIAESHLIRGAHKIAIRVGGDGIAAFENFERAAFCRGCFQARAAFHLTPEPHAVSHGRRAGLPAVPAMIGEIERFAIRRPTGKGFG